MMALPLAFLLYVLIIYVQWKNSPEPDQSFARDYWYTHKNPLSRTWWPTVAVLAYLAAVVFFALLE